MTQARIAIANDGSLPIDEQVLANLIDSIGVDATEAQIEIFDLFFESAPQLMAKVSRGANLGAWDQVRADLHALKGSCELFGATQLALESPANPLDECNPLLASFGACPYSGPEPYRTNAAQTPGP